MDYLEVYELCHHGIKGQKWGVRRYQNEDGTLTNAGKERYNNADSKDDSKTSKVLKVAEECNKSEVLKKAKCQIKVDKKGIANGESIFWKVFSDDGKLLSFDGSDTLWSQEGGDLLWERLGRPDKGDKIYDKLNDIQDKLETAEYDFDDEFEDELDLEHHGIKGQRWGIRRFQNEDGSFTDAGKARYKVDKSGNPTGSGIRKFKLDQRSIKGQQLYEKGKTVGGISTGQGISNLILGSLAVETIKAAFKGSNPSKVISRGEFRARSILAGIGAVSIASLAAINIKSHSDVNKLKAYYANGSHQYHEISKKSVKKEEK